MASFMTCPDEIHQRILFYMLVVPPQNIGLIQGLEIEDGTALVPHNGIFLVNRHLRQLAKEISLSENRITVDGDPEKNAVWFRSQPEALLHKIRRLDLQITGSQIEDPTLLKGWDELVGVLERKLLLEKLQLSIDAALYYEEMVQDVDDFSFLIPIYDQLMAPFGSGFSNVKDFYVYWPKRRSLEIKAEKKVKGDDYNAIKRGKIEYWDRDPRLVHGLEPGHYDSNGKVLPEMQNYGKVHMVDFEEYGRENMYIGK